MVANPQISICAFSKGRWLRIEGRAVPDHSRETLEAITNQNPMLKKLWEKEVKRLPLSTLPTQLLSCTAAKTVKVGNCNPIHFWEDAQI